MDSKSTQQQQPSVSSRPTLLFVLNIVIGIFLLLIGYFSYAYIAHPGGAETESATPVAKNPKQKIVQLDVLNGCGAKGAASRCTNFLRASGFDVVEMKNYRTSSMRETIVIDRVGNLEQAKRVASALGVSAKHVVQQINPDYFVDVSVVVGSDYVSLQPWRQK